MKRSLSTRPVKRTGKTATLVALWLPTDLLEQVDSVAATQELDRSKFIRRAIKSKLAKPA